MTSASRRCSECGELLPAGSRAKTCSTKCRSARHRRIKRAKAQSGRPEPGRPEWEVYDAEQHEIMQEVVKKELAPFARDQISDKVIAAIGGIMELAPAALKVLEQDMQHPDPNIRGRAAQLILKYTMPEKFLPADVGGDNEIRVTLDVPTPDFTATNGAAPEPPVEGSATERRSCSRCGQVKDETEFEAGAPRCTECQEELRKQLLPGAS